MGRNWRQIKFDLSKNLGSNLEIKFKSARVNLAKFTALVSSNLRNSRFYCEVFKSKT